MRKKLTVLLAVLAAGVFAAAAWAATPQGQIVATSGSGLTMTDAVIKHLTVQLGGIKDGQTDPLYIGKTNDGSGNCTGDSGFVTVTYKANPTVPVTDVPIICAHFLLGNPAATCSPPGSPPPIVRAGCRGMVFDFQDPVRANTWVVVRVINLGLFHNDISRAATYSSATLAQTVVNIGTDGAHVPPLTTVDTDAHWNITAAQT